MSLLLQFNSANGLKTSWSLRRVTICQRILQRKKLTLASRGQGRRMLLLFAATRSRQCLGRRFCHPPAGLHRASCLCPPALCRRDPLQEALPLSLPLLLLLFLLHCLLHPCRLEGHQRSTDPSRQPRPENHHGDCGLSCWVHLACQHHYWWVAGSHIIF